MNIVQASSCSKALLRTYLLYIQITAQNLNGFFLLFCYFEAHSGPVRRFGTNFFYSFRLSHNNKSCFRCMHFSVSDKQNFKFKKRPGALRAGSQQSLLVKSRFPFNIMQLLRINRDLDFAVNLQVIIKNQVFL